MRMMDVLELLAIVLAVIASFGLLTVLTINIYTKIRRKFPINVNCWFCNRWLKVPYASKNCFDCPYCEQYNGFTADGGYNKPIPAQHDELMNKALPLKKQQSSSPVNGLCNMCNHNQRLKIYQLAAFSPIDESNYDEEIERYQQQLERAYRLCPQCEKTIKTTLQKQKSFLLGQRLSNLRSQGLSALNISVNNKNFHTAKRTILFAIKCITLVLAFVQLIETVKKIDYTKLKLLPDHLKPYVLTAKDFTVFIPNIFSAISEYFYHLYSFTILNNNLIIRIHEYFVDLKLFNVNFIRVYLSQAAKIERCFAISTLGLLGETLVVNLGESARSRDYMRITAWALNALISYPRIKVLTSNLHYLPYVQIILLCFLLMFWSSISGQRRINMKPHTFAMNNKDSHVPEGSANTSSGKKAAPEKLQDLLTSPEKPRLNTSFGSNKSTSPFSSSSCIDSFSFFKSNDFPIFGQKAIFENPLTIAQFRFSPEYRNPCLSDDSFSTRKSIFNDSMNVSDDTVKLNDSFNSSFSEKRSDCSEFELGEELNKLHLGSYPQKLCGQMPTGFHMLGNIPRPKPVLSPPRLHNVTQSSWVAGGYWKSPSDVNINFSSFPSLSRSSSQSSGFGSQSSSQNLNNLDTFNSLPPSRNNSLCEFDKYSVFSEPAYHYTKNSSYNRMYPMNDQFCVIPRTQTISPNYLSRSPIPNDKVLKSHEIFRPNSSSSILSQPLVQNFNVNRKNFETYTDFGNPFYAASSVSSLYRPRNSVCSSGYVKGSLLQKWREQNGIKLNNS